MIADQIDKQIVVECMTRTDPEPVACAATSMRLMDLARRVAASDCTVLIVGDAIHLPRTSQSDRRRDKGLSTKINRGRKPVAAESRHVKKKSRKYRTTPFAAKQGAASAPKKKRRPGKRERSQRKKEK